MDEHAAAWERLRRLAAESNSYGGLRTLGRLAAALAGKAGPAPDLHPLRIALVGGGTPDLLADPLRAACVGCGILPDLYVGGYGEFPAGFLDPDGALSRFAPRLAIVLNTSHGLIGRLEFSADREAVDALVRQECQAMLGAAKVFNERTSAGVAFHTLPVSDESQFGSLAWKMPAAAENFLARFNLRLGELAPPSVHLIDAAGMAARIGSRQWFDPRFWFHAKQPIGFAAVPAWTGAVTAVIRAILGRSRKVVILDLDNTLWGGIVGDDGVEGLMLGEGTGDGEAFKSFQLYLQKLRQSGVLLAVCSKNDESIALDAIDRHPEMVLRRDEFVAIKANWRPKSDNIRELAEQLDLGLDSFVFVDDNPAEREQVRRELPEVAVPEMGDDPSYYAAVLSGGRWFERTSITEEDWKRTEAYRSRALAAASMEGATDLSSYLRSLEMKAVIRPFETLSMERITQLTNKTNQFNLTTRRVVQSEMERFAGDDTWITFSARLRDRFGDHGLISVFFAEIRGKQMVIEGWLMSCRVLKRGLEQALFERVLEKARERGIDELIGIFRPTDRNALVRDMYGDLGFQKVSETEQETRWRLRVAGAEAPEHFIAIELEADEGGATSASKPIAKETAP